MKLLFYILFISMIGIFVSCEDYKDCNSPVQTSLGIRFYQLIDQNASDSTLPSLTMYGIGGKDSMLANKEAVGEIFVPLNQNSDSTGFFLQPDSTKQNGDTIFLSYTRNLRFVSSGCGFTTFYQLDTVTYTHHYIDSIALSTKKIVTTNATNLKIFY